MDKICLQEITVQALIGILPEEQTTRQRLRVSVEMELSLEKAGRTDKIEHTVNYADVEQAVLTLAQESHFNLIERFAQAVADATLLFPMVEKVTVLVSKPDILLHTNDVSVSITRSK